MRFLLPVLTLGLSVATTFAQPDLAEVEIRTTPVAGNVFMLEGAGGNIGVLKGEDGVLIVDNQFAPLAPKIEAAIEKLGSGPVRYVINTHWHGDHTGGNEHFGAGAAIVAHENVRRRLAERASPAVRPEGLPEITHDHGVTLHFHGEEVRVIALSPGHTDGDSLVWFMKANVLHLGDQFFSGRFPFIDLGSGGSVEGYLRNVAKALELAPEGVKIIPGHGPLSTIADLREFHAMLEESVKIVREAIRQGRSLDEVKSRGLPEKWREWGTGFINTSRWLEIVYNDVKKD